MPDLDCRVAKLEAQREIESADCSAFQAQIAESLRDLTKELHELKIQREKQMSFIGGMAAVVSIVATVAGFVINKYF